MGTAKANETLDTLTKVGGAFFQDPAIKQTILTGLNTSRTKFIAACTVDHTTWTSSAFPVILPPYPNGGVYPVPDIVSAMAINEFAFHIAWSAGNQRDDIVAYYVDDSGNCTTLASQTFDNATPEWPDRIGPRMGIMLDGNSQAWLFAVANANSTFSPGALLALSIPNNGQGAGTWTNISGLLGRNFWHPAADAAPIVAARSSAAGGKRPFVATALDGSTVAAVLWDGFNWQAAVQSLPMTVGLGSAIAISTTPADLLSDVNYKLYEFILVAGTNGHLYETRFLQNKKTNVYSLGAMIDLGVISATWSVDTWYDGLTASWYSKNGLDYQTVYARAKSSSGAIANYTTDISMTNVIQGWTNTTVATQNNWTAADSFVGAQMAVKYPVGFGWANDVGASCNNGNNIFCSLKSVLGQNAFSWTFPTMP